MQCEAKAPHTFGGVSGHHRCTNTAEYQWVQGISPAFTRHTCKLHTPAAYRKAKYRIKSTTPSRTLTSTGINPNYPNYCPDRYSLPTEVPNISSKQCKQTGYHCPYANPKECPRATKQKQTGGPP